MVYIRKTQDIFVSDKLRSILLEIKDSSLVARLLLKAKHPKDILQEEIVNYLSVSDVDETKISYLNQERIDKLPEDQNPWEHHKRLFARPGAVVNKIFKDVSGKDIELFNNMYKSVLNRTKFTLSVVTGDDIKRYYKGESYLNSSGSLGNSCMKYENCQKYLNIYSDNADVISMLIMLDEQGYLIGRALLWNFDSNKIMDRIYTSNDEELSYHFKKWANDNGYLYKQEQKFNNTLMFESNGNRTIERLTINLKNYKYDRYPYMDTFKFFDSNKGTLQNFIDPQSVVTTLCAPDGAQLPGDHLSLCISTNLFYYRGDTVNIFYLDGKIDRNLTQRAYSQNVNWSRANDMYLLKEDSEYVEDIDDFIFKGELSVLNNMEYIDAKRKEKKERDEKRLKSRMMSTEAPTEAQSWSALTSTGIGSDFYMPYETHLRFYPPHPTQRVSRRRASDRIAPQEEIVSNEATVTTSVNVDESRATETRATETRATETRATETRAESFTEAADLFEYWNRNLRGQLGVSRSRSGNNAVITSSPYGTSEVTENVTENNSEAVPTEQSSRWSRYYGGVDPAVDVDTPF